MDRVGQASEEHQSESWRKFVQQGQALLEKNAVIEAIEALEKAEEVASENSTVQTLLALAYFKAGRWEQSARLYGTLAAADPADVMVRLNAAVSFLQLGQHGKARPHLEEAVALQPEFTKARSLLGTVYRSLGWLEEAREQFAQSGQEDLAKQMEEKMRSQEALLSPVEDSSPMDLLQDDPSAPKEGDFHEAISAEFSAALQKLNPESLNADDDLPIDDLDQLEFAGLDLGDPVPFATGNMGETGGESAEGAFPVIVLPAEEARAREPARRPAAVVEEDVLPFALTPHQAQSPRREQAMAQMGQPSATTAMPLWVDIPGLFDNEAQVFALLEDGRLFMQIQSTGYSRLNDLMLLVGKPDVQWESKRFQGKPIEQIFGPRDNPVARIEGKSYLLLGTPEERKRTSVLLAGADVAYFREGAVLAFGPEIQWENGRVPSALTGINDLPLDNFWGEGELILESDGPVWGVPVKRDKRVRVEYDRLIGWVGSLVPQIIADDSLSPSLKMRAFVEFEGEGGILISS